MSFPKAIRNPDAVYFIAEAGVNHNGDLDLAFELIDAAANAGADAVKFQTLDADRLVTEEAPKATYQQRATDSGSQHEMIRQYELGKDEHAQLIERCARNDITFLSTPFDPESANLLDDFDVPMLKIGSGELDNHPFLEHVAGFGRSLIVSTGMATMEEVENAYDLIRSVDSTLDLALLHCTSEYPTTHANTNLRAMQIMDETFPVPVGHSDHTPDIETPSFAAAAGAAIVEKHFTMDRTLPGPDHEFALEPDGLARAVSLARNAATARGSPVKRPTSGEMELRELSRKGLHARRDLEPGDTLTEEVISIKRPATGISPAHLSAVLDKQVQSPIEGGEPIRWETLETEQ
ncbi:N-acetylneuraminate synthase family protein [Natrialbaceae archaeon A-CW1-1]